MKFILNLLFYVYIYSNLYFCEDIIIMTTWDIITLYILIL